MTIFKRLFLLIPLLLFLLPASAAAAATPSPGWTMDSLALPTSFSSNDGARCFGDITANSSEPRCDSYEVTATDAGSRSMDASNVTLTDTIPAGLTVEQVLFYWSGFPVEFGGPVTDLSVFGLCAHLPVASGTEVKCELPHELFGLTLPLIAPDDTLKMIVDVTVNEPQVPGPLTSSATISGGGAPEASTTVHNQIGVPPAFGPSNFDFYIDGSDGAPDTQAGGHPYELTTTIDLNSEFRDPPDKELVEATSVEDVKDVVVDLPLGFAGSTLAAPECTFAQLSSKLSKFVGGCPPDTVVGHIEAGEGVDGVNGPIYNLVPEHGYAGEFAYADASAGVHVFYVHVVPTAAGYVLQATNPDVPQIKLRHIVVTFYGDPAERNPNGNANIPFFTNPTGCANGPLRATIWMDSWQHPARFSATGTPANLEEPAWAKMTSESPAVAGCNALQFAPELKAQPTTKVADSPSGLEFEMRLPQYEEADTTATPALKTATVTLPEGMTVDPSAGNGLGACSPAQIGWQGGSPFNFTPAQPECPESSKVGTLELTTPLIPGTLTGEMYLASENENPYGSVLGAYVVVNDPVTGVLLKIAGKFEANPQTGRITATFAENPQLPFSDLKLHFFGGPRAELTTPEGCGTFTTTSALEPWSAPDSGPSPEPFDSYQIESGCVSGFAPAFTAGSTNLQAGAYSPFELSFSRQDTDQELAGLTDTFPPGVLAKLAGVPLCSDADASAGTCPAGSQIGTVQALAGPGPNPLIQTGRVYLTGSYKGAPYGESVVVPAIAGPFNFGLVVVRGAIYVDPHTGQATVVSDPFPTILDVKGANGQTVGIPIRLRRVDVTVDRPEFTFNPTNCAKLQATGTITSTQGQSSSLATPFQVTNCQTLKFQPTFAVSAKAAKNTRLNGATLTAKLSYPNTTQGTEADIARVKVELPKALPSRLTTLRKACTAAQFEANPAGCPAASKIGTATVRTPILPAPLKGPAIFVSHGGEAWPSLTMVLQGDGVTVDLVGTTLISKAGVTSTTFKTLPDTPFSTFELTLPQGEFSALTALGNLCKQRLTMPTEFIAQNGAEIHESTTVEAQGCGKAKKAHHQRKKHTRKKKARSRKKK